MKINNLCEGGRDVWESLVQDMEVTRKAEPASETDKNQLERSVVPSVQAPCHVASQCPPTAGKTKSLSLSAGLDHVVCFGQWDVSRLGAGGMNVHTSFCLHFCPLAKEMCD